MVFQDRNVELAKQGQSMQEAGIAQADPSISNSTQAASGFGSVGQATSDKAILLRALLVSLLAGSLLLFAERVTRFDLLWVTRVAASLSVGLLYSIWLRTSDPATRPDFALSFAKPTRPLWLPRPEPPADLTLEEHSHAVAELSHDLRTPLTALFAALDQVEMTLEEAGGIEVSGPSLPTTLQGLLDAARGDARRISELVDQLSAVSQQALLNHNLSHAGSSFRAGLVELDGAGLAREILRNFRPWCDQVGVMLLSHVAPEVMPVPADRSSLQRALENLLRNAIQHADQRVEVSLIDEDEELCFEVADDGPGLVRAPSNEGMSERAGESANADDQQEEPVSPAGELVPISELVSSKTKPHSHGIGLQVVDRVAALHGGRVEACNGFGGGAVFRLYIPRSLPEAETPIAAPSTKTLASDTDRD